MFDMGFTEMMLIAVVALVVIGPERLPKVARTIGHLFGRAQRYVTDVKSEINREMEIEELRKLQAEMQGAARKFETDVQKSMRETEDSIRKETTLAKAEFDALEAELDEAVAQESLLKQASQTKKDDGGKHGPSTEETSPVVEQNEAAPPKGTTAAKGSSVGPSGTSQAEH